MNVQTPDGKVVSFPDSMSSRDIEKALEELYPAPKAVASASTPVSQNTTVLPSWERIPLGLGTAALEGAVGGANMLGGVVRDAIPGMKEALVPGLEKKLGITAEQPTGSDPYGLETALHNQLIGPLKAQSTAESLGQGAAFGLGSTAIPAALTGGMSLPIALAGTAGGTAAEGTKLLGGSPAMQIAAGLAAGFSTQALGAGVRTIAHIAGDLGDSATLQQAGTKVQTLAEDWRQNILPQKLADASSPLDAAVPASTTLSPTELIRRAQDLLSRGGQAANAVRDFLSGTAKSGGALGATAQAVQGGLTSSALGTPALPSLTWQEARAFRTELGQQLRTAKPAERPALEHLYAGATDDLGTTAAANGAGDQFAAFNAESTRLHNLDRGPIEEILSRDPGDAAQRLLTRSARQGTILQGLRTELPEAVDELASAHLRLNPDARAWGRLASEAQEQLVLNPADRAIIQAAAPQKGAPGLGTKMLESLVGGTVGGAGARIIGNALVPGVNPLVTEAAGELIGNVAPFVGRSLRRAVANPLVPASGALGGSNVP